MDYGNDGIQVNGNSTYIRWDEDGRNSVASSLLGLLSLIISAYYLGLAKLGAAEHRLKLVAWCL